MYLTKSNLCKSPPLSNTCVGVKEKTINLEGMHGAIGEAGPYHGLLTAGEGEVARLKKDTGCQLPMMSADLDSEHYGVKFCEGDSHICVKRNNQSFK